MQFIIEISDKDFNLLDRLEKEAIKVNWDYSAVGGCGSFSFDLPRRFCDEKFISGDFNIKIKKRGSAGAYSTVYQGLVEDKLPNVKASNEFITVQGHGYQTQLSRIYISESDGTAKIYTGMEMSDIVKDLLDNFIVPNTDITYSAPDIENTGFTPSTLKFSTDALSALQTCADITGTREWGVGPNRDFFFKERSSSVGFRYVMGSPQLLDFSVDYSFGDIINRVVIQGGDVDDGSGGTIPFTPDPTGAAYNDISSQLKYNLRTKVIQNSSITTDDVAEQYAASILAELSSAIRKGQANILSDTPIETTIPIPLCQIISKAETYGQKAFGTGLYSGRISYQIKRVNYSLDDNSNLKIQIELGKLRPTLSEKFSQVLYEIEQLRSTAL